MEGVLGSGLTLHEVIAAEIATIRCRSTTRSDWVREHVDVAAGARRARRAARPADRLERLPRADRAGARARGGRRSRSSPNRSTRSPTAGGAVWRDEARARSAASRASAALLAGEPLVFVGDGYSDRCAALAADRVFARDGLAVYLDEQGVAVRAVRDAATMSLLRFPEPYDFELSTERFRASAPTSRTCWSTVRCIARSAGGRCASPPRPAGVDVEPLDDETRPVVLRLLGAPFELEPFYAWAADDAVLGRDRRPAARASGRRSRPIRSRRSSPRSPPSRSRCSPPSRSATG